MNKDKLIEKMRQEAKAYNKHLTDNFFDGLSFHGLLNFCHPLSREKYLDDYRKVSEG